MPDFMDEKASVVFTPMIKFFKHTVWLFAALVTLWGCDKSSSVTENIPKGLVNLTIDLNLSSNLHLNNVGTHSYFEGGIKGVLLIHDYDGEWYAFERTCAHEPTKACSQIWVDSINIQLMCGTYSGKTFEPCCSSTYMYSGFPTNGPAAGRLAQYYVSRNGNLIQVHN